MNRPNTTGSRLPIGLKALSMACALSAFVAIQAVPISEGKALAAQDLPLATSSPIAGITFDDRPISLPVQRNFQMAMLTVSSEMGQSCGRMESYGWRLDQTEQQRVDGIFNSTVDRLRSQGFSVDAKAPSSVSRDVTVFTANRSDKHIIFMWSAGEVGLAMLLCETSAPPMESRLASSYQSPSRGTAETMAPAFSRQPPATVTSPKTSGTRISRSGKQVYDAFSPIGEWKGSYACSQGTTGVNLKITQVRGERIEGLFHFFPTSKNPYVPSGSYTVYGEYDQESQRVLLNPGKWIKRPKNYYNTIIIGSFDPVSLTFSAYFQGIVGCTSLEAKLAGHGSAYDRETADFEKTANQAMQRAIAAKEKAETRKKKSSKKTPAAKSVGLKKPADAQDTHKPDGNAGINLPASAFTATPPVAPAAK